MHAGFYFILFYIFKKPIICLNHEQQIWQVDGLLIKINVMGLLLLATNSYILE